MNEATLSKNSNQFIIKIIPVISFSLFVLYQLGLAIFLDANRIGRLVGVGFYVLITVAACLNFSERYGVWIAHSVILIAVLLLMLAYRMLNLQGLIDGLKTSSSSSVLLFVQFILTQVGSLVLVAAYLALTASITVRQMRKLEFALMFIVVLLFVSSFVVECILILKYRLLVDFSVKVSLVSRFVFCLGYVGIAASFLLPAPEKEKEEDKSGEFFYSDEEQKDIDMII